jgi:hypothetical protein
LHRFILFGVKNGDVKRIGGGTVNVAELAGDLEHPVVDCVLSVTPRVFLECFRYP